MLNKTLNEGYTHVVAETKWALSFQGWVHFCLLALITVNFCSIFKNKVSKSKLKLFSIKLNITGSCIWFQS